MTVNENELRKMVRFMNRHRLVPDGLEPDGWRYKLTVRPAASTCYYAYLDLVNGRNEPVMEIVELTVGYTIDEACARLLKKWASGRLKNMAVAAGSLEELKLKAAAYGK